MRRSISSPRALKSPRARARANRRSVRRKDTLVTTTRTRSPGDRATLRADLKRAGRALGIVGTESEAARPATGSQERVSARVRASAIGSKIGLTIAWVPRLDAQF